MQKCYTRRKIALKQFTFTIYKEQKFRNDYSGKQLNIANVYFMLIFSKTLRFSDVFRGCRKSALGKNRFK